MANDRVQLDSEPAGDGSKQPTEFPIPSLRQFLLPDTLLYVHWFRAFSYELDIAVNQWIDLHKVIVVAASSPVTDGVYMTMSITYVSPDGRPIVDG